MFSVNYVSLLFFSFSAVTWAQTHRAVPATGRLPDRLLAHVSPGGSSYFLMETFCLRSSHFIFCSLKFFFKE